MVTHTTDTHAAPSIPDADLDAIDALRQRRRALAYMVEVEHRADLAPELDAVEQELAESVRGHERRELAGLERQARTAAAVVAASAAQRAELESTYHALLAESVEAARRLQACMDGFVEALTKFGAGRRQLYALSAQLGHANHRLLLRPVIAGWIMWELRALAPHVERPDLFYRHSLPELVGPAPAEVNGGAR